MIMMRSVSLHNLEKSRKEQGGALFKALIALVLAVSLALVPGLAFATQDDARTSKDQEVEAASISASDTAELDGALIAFQNEFEEKGYENTGFNKAQYAYSKLISSGAFDATSSNDSGRELIVHAFNNDNSQTFNSNAFHEAMTLLLVKIGIPEGDIKPASSGDHTWTLVKLDGEWTHIDAASNASSDGADDLAYLYFGLTDSQIKMVHSNYNAQGNPSATSTKNNYYLNSSDTVIKTDQTDKVEQDIKNQIKNGKYEFTIPVSSDGTSGTDTLIYAQYGNSLNGQEVDGHQVFVTFTPNANGNGGTYTVRLKGEKSIDKASVEGIYQKPYTGKQAVQNPVVKYEGKTLKEGTDYRIRYENATNATSEAVIIITGLGEYADSEKRIMFTISKTDIASTKVAGNFQSIMKWTGSEIKQDSITLKDSYRTLTRNDYKISYKNNKNPGVATLIVEGQGNYSGRKEIAFTIEKAAADQNKPSDITTQGLPSAPRVTGKWVKSGSRWWYSYDAKTQAAQKKKYPANEWVIIGGKYYHFDGAGWMHKNWLQLNKKWYWLGSDGAMKFKWIKTGGKWYYLSPSDGVMQTGKKNIDKQVYFLNSDGAMRIGWSNEGTSKEPLWYFYNSSGAMAKGWIKTGGKWYYLDTSNGLMQKGKKEIGKNTFYYLDKSSGAMKTGWVLDGTTWYYCNSSGAMAKGWLKLKNTWYYLDPSSCVMQKWWQDIGGKRYFFEQSGAMVTGWVGINNVTYYFDGSGALQRDKWIGKYHVDKDGKLDKQR